MNNTPHPFRGHWEYCLGQPDCADLVDCIRANVSQVIDYGGDGDDFRGNVIDTVFVEKAVAIPEWVSWDDVHNIYDAALYAAQGGAEMGIRA